MFDLISIDNDSSKHFTSISSYKSYGNISKHSTMKFFCLADTSEPDIAEAEQMMLHGA